MKITREFSRKANGSGKLVFRRVRTLIVPMKFVRATAKLAGTEPGTTLSFSFQIDKEVLAQGSVPGDQPIVIEPKVRVKAGEREFLFTAEGFAPDQSVSGVVDVEFSFF